MTRPLENLNAAARREADRLDAIQSQVAAMEPLRPHPTNFRGWADCPLCRCSVNDCRCDPDDYQAALLSKAGLPRYPVQP